MAAEEEITGKAYDSRLMGRLLHYLRPYALQVSVAMTAIVLKAACDVAGPFLMMVAIDRYLSGSRAAGLLHLHGVVRVSHFAWLEGHLSPDPWHGITQVAAIMLALLLASFLFEFTQTYLMQWSGQKVMFDMRKQIYRHLQRMHIGYFDANPVGRLVTRVTTDVDALNDMFTGGVISIVEDSFVLTFIIAVMLRTSWWLALIAFAVLPFIIVATWLFRNSVRRSFRRIRSAIARINSHLQEHVTGIIPLQLFNRERRAFDTFQEANAAHMIAYKDAIMAYAVYYPTVDFLSMIAVAAIVWWGGGALLLGGVQLGVLIAFIQYTQRFFRPIMDLSDKFNILQSAMAASERIFKLLDTAPEILSPEHPALPSGRGGIEFDHVWFAYKQLPEEQRTGNEDEDWEWILRDVSFSLNEGETAAIVGHTGAGKTTLISLLLRFYDVQRGTVRVGGTDVRELDLQALRRSFGVVLQDPFLFSGTIDENIRLGTEGITREAVEEAAEEVNLSAFLQTLPGGLDAPVNERGTTLSTGQKQLISFARALAHDPKILILDEATSSVDTETEFHVREALTRLVEGRTSLIVAHRLSTVQRADRIIVMHKGRVREVGNHQQLLAQRGIYYKLYQLQYKDQEIPA
jgi:ATP-binding cassette subfamily B protein